MEEGAFTIYTQYGYPKKSKEIICMVLFSDAAVEEGTMVIHFVDTTITVLSYTSADAQRAITRKQMLDLPDNDEHAS